MELSEQENHNEPVDLTSTRNCYTKLTNPNVKPRRKQLSLNSEGKAYNALALIYRLQGRWVDAIEAAVSSVKNSPQDEQARNLLMTLLLERGDFESAIREGKAWLKQSPNSVPALECLEKAYWQKVDHKAGIRCLTSLLKLIPEDTAYRLRRAQLYEYLQCWTLALEDCHQVWRMGKNSIDQQLAQKRMESLDQIQISKISQLLNDDQLFRLEFRLNRETAIVSHGFALSEHALEYLQWLQSECGNSETNHGSLYVPFD